MAIIPQGYSGTAAEVEANTRAIRAVMRPYDIGFLGSYYQTSNAVGSAGGGTGQKMVNFRSCLSAGVIALVRRITMSLCENSTGFSNGGMNFDLTFRRVIQIEDSSSFDVAPSQNTSVNVNSYKMRSAFQWTQVRNFKFDSGTGAGGGSVTLDSQPLASFDFGVNFNMFGIGVGSTILFEARAGEHPIVLMPNEGFVVQLTRPGTGSADYVCAVQWDEVAAY